MGGDSPKVSAFTRKWEDLELTAEQEEKIQEFQKRREPLAVEQSFRLRGKQPYAAKAQEIANKKAKAKEDSNKIKIAAKQEAKAESKVFVVDMSNDGFVLPARYRKMASVQDADIVIVQSLSLLGQWHHVESGNPARGKVMLWPIACGMALGKRFAEPEYLAATKNPESHSKPLTVKYRGSIAVEHGIFLSDSFKAQASDWEQGVTRDLINGTGSKWILLDDEAKKRWSWVPKMKAKMSVINTVVDLHKLIFKLSKLDASRSSKGTFLAKKR